jgi:hypothetical protein
VTHPQVLATLLLETFVELDPVSGQLRLELAGPVAHEASAGARRLCAEIWLSFEQHHARPGFGEVQRRGRAQDAAAGDDDIDAHQSATAPSGWK